MDAITEFSIVPLTSSNYLAPKTVHYKQNGQLKNWDCITEHSDVSVLLYNTSRNVFILVKQFRPAVYLYNAKPQGADAGDTLDTKQFPGSLGLTLELCSGLVDKKGKTLEEVAQEEVLEECGYEVAVKDLRRITQCRNDVAITGSMMTVFYAEVTDRQKVGRGGGLAEEGEMIEVIEVPVDQAWALLYDETVNRELGLLLALQWFFDQSRVVKQGR